MTSKQLFMIAVSLWISTLFVVMQEITYQVIHSSAHGKHDGANFESVHHSIHKLDPLLVSTCNLFSLYLLCKSIFLWLLLCRVVTSKVFRM